MASHVEKRTPYIKPSDARAWLHCHRRVWFDHFPPKGLAKVEPSAFDALVMEMGLAHELAVKLKLEKQCHRMDAASPQHTQDLMQAGIPLIYHPKFVDETVGIIAEPDFLIRTDSGEYQVADAKLAKRNDKEGKKDKKAIQIQLAVYRKMLKATGVPPFEKGGLGGVFSPRFPLGYFIQTTKRLKWETKPTIWLMSFYRACAHCFQ